MITPKQLPLSEEHYNAKVTKKTQIVLHHTAGSHRPDYTIQGWAATSTRVGAHLVIGGKSTSGDATYDGAVYQCVDYKYWLWHLGLKAGTCQAPHGAVDGASVGIEICNYGALTKQADGTFLHYLNKPVPQDQVVDLGFEWRGYQYWHAYTDAQLATLKEFIPQLSATLGFSLEKGKVWTVDDFKFDPNGYMQKPLAFHVSYRTDKVDLNPQPKLIAMLNEIHAA